MPGPTQMAVIFALAAGSALGAQSSDSGIDMKKSFGSAKPEALFTRQEMTICGPNSEDGKCGMNLCCSAYVLREYLAFLFHH